MENTMLKLVTDDHQHQELARGHLVVKNFFDNYSEKEIKNRLWDFFKGYTFYCEQWGESENCFESLAFYEDLKEVLESCNMLQNNITTQAAGMDLSPIELSKCPENLLELAGHIIKSIPVEYIFYIRKIEGKPEIVIVLDKTCNKPFAELEPLIEFVKSSFPDILFTLNSYSSIIGMLGKGHIFYNKTFTEQNLIYAKTNAKSLSKINSDISEENIIKAKSLFDAGIYKVQRFYEGAEQYLKNGHCGIAAFMLHQSCELTFRTLLLVLKGEDIKSHSPKVLRKHLQRFAPEIIGVFSEDEEIEIQTLNLMEEAYLKSRYEPDYTVEWSVLNYWYERVGVLQQKAVEIVSAYW